MSHDFEAFMSQRETAANEYVNGNAEPLDALTTRTDPATFFSPGSKNSPMSSLLR